MMNGIGIMKSSTLYGLSALVALSFIGALNAATPQQAEEITQNYERTQKLWASEMSLAPNDQARRMVMAKRPNPATYAARLKALLARDLAQAWTLKYGAWLLENDPELKDESQYALLDAVEKNHIASPDVGQFSLAMTNLSSGTRARGMQLLEKIKQTNPNTQVQGQAALSLSILLSSMGDEGVIMKRRLTNIREAVVKSADTRVGSIAVNDIIKEELYKINNLSKGRKAPEINGVDSGQRPLSLSSYQGKVVMLVFWSSWDEDSIKVLDILKKTHESKLGKPFAVLGVNRDDLMTLRRVEAEEMMGWKNVSDPKRETLQKYRVSTTPYCMVLDQKGVIKYRGNIGSFANAVADDLIRPAASKP